MQKEFISLCLYKLKGFSQKKKKKTQGFQKFSIQEKQFCETKRYSDGVPLFLKIFIFVISYPIIR